MTILSRARKCARGRRAYKAARENDNLDAAKELYRLCNEGVNYTDIDPSLTPEAVSRLIFHCAKRRRI